MSKYKETLKQIKESVKRRKDGKLNAIPFGFKRFDKVFPGIVKGLCYALTGATNSAKTQLTKNLFVQRPYKFMLDNPSYNIRLKVFWFGLEESYEEFMLSMISNKLYHDTGLLVDANQLMNRSESILNPKILELLESKEYEEYYKQFEEWIEIIDHVYTVDDIVATVLKYAIDNGTFYVKEEPVVPSIKDSRIIYTELDGTVHKSCTHYKANDPDVYVIGVIDHFSLIESEGNSILHADMSRLSSIMRKTFAKKCNYTPVFVHQQVMDGDNEKSFKDVNVEPALSSLGDNRMVGRDYQVVISIFNPHKHNKAHYKGYDILRLRDRFRQVNILKSRISVVNKGTSLSFYGECNQFYELPPNLTSTQYEEILAGTFKS